MKFVDQVRVFVQAGSGGDGAVAWRREKYVPRGGPAGGDGGRGGDVVFQADGALSTLLDLRFRQHLRAENGRAGGSRDMNGRGGESLRIRVPVGTMVFVEAVTSDPTAAPWRERDPEADDDEDGGLETIYVVDDEIDGSRLAQLRARAAAEAANEPDAEGEDPDPDPDRRDAAEGLFGSARPPARREDLMPGDLLGDLTADGQELVIAHGGRGGRGNIHFRSSTNRAPDHAEEGTPGEAMWLRLELKLLADVGVVGFPNVGKSTFIRRVSRARPKVGAYPFTTLVPQLGVVRLGEGRSMVIADVPGLIRGASEGRGLGHQFLRHLERTRVLLHVLAPDPDPDRAPLADLDALEEELTQYGGFESQPRVVAINKIDALKTPAGRRFVAEARDALHQRNIPLFPISAETGEGVDRLLEAIWRRLH